MCVLCGVVTERLHIIWWLVCVHFNSFKLHVLVCILDASSDHSFQFPIGLLFARLDVTRCVCVITSPSALLETHNQHVHQLMGGCVELRFTPLSTKFQSYRGDQLFKSLFSNHRTVIQELFNKNKQTKQKWSLVQDERLHHQRRRRHAATPANDIW